jgi:pyrroline-5-carboxylate reductase
MNLKSKKLGFIGAGNMSKAIIKGLLASEEVRPKGIFISDINKKRLQKAKKELGINAVSSNSDLVLEADIIIVAVKPQDIRSVLENIASCIKKDQVIISIAAGVTLKTLSTYLKKKHIVRVMPNLGCFINESASALSFLKGEKKNVKVLAESIFGAIGAVVEVSEEEMDIVTALSGSGPAYIALFNQILLNSARKAGLDYSKAKMLFHQTHFSTSHFLKHGLMDSQSLIERVSSKGGTTEAALKQFKKMKLEKVLDSGFKAAIKRSKELSK